MLKVQVICSVPIEKWYTYEFEVDSDFADELIDAWDNASSEARELLFANYHPELVDVHVHETVKSEEDRTYSKLLLYPGTMEEFQEMVWGMGEIAHLHIHYPTTVMTTDKSDVDDGAMTDEQV